MDNDEIERVRKDIYDFPKNNKFFKENNFARACYALTRLYEQLIVEIMADPDLMVSGAADALHPTMLAAYRQTLKDAYRFCEEGDAVERAVPEEQLKAAHDEMLREVEFNHIRNQFERFDLGQIDIKIEGNRLSFIMKDSFRGRDAELYSRWVDKKKPIETQKTLKNDASQKLAAQLVSPAASKFWNVRSQSPTSGGKKYFKELIEAAKLKIVNDAEVSESFAFSEFTLDEFRAVYAVLLALGVMSFNYAFDCYKKKSLCFSTSGSVVFKKKDELIAIIKEYTALQEDKIQYILQLLTYDPKFHADKIVIYQPLFVFGENVFYSPILVFYAFAQDKLIAFLKAGKTEEATITKIARTREEVMTNDILDVIEKESDLLFSTNFKIIEDGITRAEYDIILYDEEINCLLLTELKWFFKIDGEYDQVRKIDDLKLKQTIEKRIEKQKMFECNVKKYLSEDLEVQTERDPEIMSCIVSQNNSGSPFLQDDLPVFDRFIFIEALRAAEFKLDRFFKLMKEHKYIPDMEALGVKYIDDKIEYAGYEIYLRKIAMK